MNKMFISMIVILAFLPSVFPIGISPAQKDWVYQLEPQHYELKIVNNEKKDMDVILSATGTLRDYIKFDQKKISFTKEDNIKIVGYTATLLSELEPGSNEGHIVAEETIPNARFGESYVTAKLNFVSIVRVEVPLKDKFLLAKLDVSADDNNVNVKATVSNKGTKEIDALSASFIVQDDDKPIATKALPARQLKEDKDDELKAIFNAKDITPGLYSAVATLNYDGNSLKLVKQFQIGAVNIKINDFDKIFTEKKINQFNANLESSWNQELKNLYVEVFIFR